MLTFTDPRLYVMGIGVGYMTSLVDGSIKYWSDKMQEGNTSFSASDNVLSAGIGNSPAIIIPTDPNVTVNVTAGDYSEYVKSASVGGTISYGAPVMTCQQITASGTSLTISVDDETPVAGPGMNKVVCYVQAVGAASPIATGGVAYELNPTTGAISGFVATNGTTYIVNYYVSRANASMTTITSNIKGEVVRFVYARPIYTVYDPATNSGDLYGYLYEIVPRLQLMPDGATNSGSQTSYTTTGITGRALLMDADTITGGCNDCAIPGSPLMYRVIVPCDAESGIEGIIGELGGVISIKIGESFQMQPAIVINGALSYGTPATDFAYSSSSTGVASIGSATGILVGVSAGTTQITVGYTVGETTYNDYVDVTVTSA